MSTPSPSPAWDAALSQDTPEARTRALGAILAPQPRHIDPSQLRPHWELVAEALDRGVLVVQPPLTIHYAKN